MKTDTFLFKWFILSTICFAFIRLSCDKPEVNNPNLIYAQLEGRYSIQYLFEQDTLEKTEKKYNSSISGCSNFSYFRVKHYKGQSSTRLTISSFDEHNVLFKVGPCSGKINKMNNDFTFEGPFINGLTQKFRGQIDTSQLGKPETKELRISGTFSGIVLLPTGDTAMVKKGKFLLIKRLESQVEQPKDLPDSSIFLIKLLKESLDTTATKISSRFTSTKIKSYENVFGKTVRSPNGKYYARELKPAGYGKIGVYYHCDDQHYQTFFVQTHEIPNTPNDLKALVWSPDSKLLATLYHFSGGGHTSVVDVATKKVVCYIRLNSYCHDLGFSRDGGIISCRQQTCTIKN